MRPANIVTAVADVLAGIAISGYFAQGFTHFNQWGSVVLLCLSTMGLYGGGVVFNDVFDAELDAIERPERPIPSGLIPKKEAITLGIFLVMMGVVAAMALTFTSGLLAAGIAASALVYDKWGKHQTLLGPINMGLCRGLNLLLGISIIPAAITQWGYLALAPIIYIAAITMISRGEVFGGRKKTLYFAGVLYALVILAIAGVAVWRHDIPFTILFLVGFSYMIYSPLSKAISDPAGKNIGKAVKAGVLALILMNAAWAAAFGALPLAIVIVILLPISLKLARLFAVT